MSGTDPSAERPDLPPEGASARRERDVRRRELARQVVTIGRSKSADIRLRDGRLSRKHCQIIPLGGGYLISDLDSRNGTVVNGESVSKHLLRPGDCIVLGGFRLDFTGDALIITEELAAEAATPTIGTASIGPSLIGVAGPAEHGSGRQPAVAPSVWGTPAVEPVPTEAPVETPVETPVEALAEAPAEAPAEVPAEAPTVTSEVDRLAAYLRSMGADAALLAKALAHVTDAPASAPVAPAAPEADGPGADLWGPAAFQLVRPAALGGAPGAALLMAPPPGMPAADPLGDTVRLHGRRPAPTLASRLAAARVRGGAAGVAVAVHLGLLFVLSAIVVVAAQFAPGVPAAVDLAPPAEAAFAADPPAPELPPAPSTAAADRRIAAAARDAGRLELEDWHTDARPESRREVRSPGAIAVAQRFADVTSRAPATGGAPALFANRFEPARSHALRAAGASSRLEPAVAAALGWLAAHQRDDGLWSAGAQACGHAECAGVAGNPAYDIGVTGLALLALAGHGEGGRDSAYAATVSRGLAALRRQTQADGWIGERRGKAIYNHVVATLAALELAVVTGRPGARTLAKGGLHALAAAQIDGLGWRYRRERVEADTAVTAWAGITFALATRLGWHPPEEALRTAVDWTRRVYDPGAGRVGYLVRGDGGSRFADAVADYPRAAAMSAAGALLLQFAGVADSDPVLGGALGDVAQHPPVSQVRDCYAWQFGACAMAQAGGGAWASYASALQATLLERQVATGAAAGGFLFDDAWTSAGGRVYTTAMATLALESVYRYARVSDLDR